MFQRLRDTLHPRIKFLLRYGISGVMGGVTQLVAVYVAVEIFHVWYMDGVVIGFIFALTVSFVLQKFWTFREPSKERAKGQFAWYSLVALGVLWGNIFFMHLFVERFGIWYLWAQALTIFIVALGSFLLNNFITFRHSEHAIFRG